MSENKPGKKRFRGVLAGVAGVAAAAVLAVLAVLPAIGYNGAVKLEG